MIKLIRSFNNLKHPLSTCEMPHKLGEFGAVRRHDIHTGIDLYCSDNQEVFSITDGIVTDIQEFTGFNESPWWNDTYAIIINNGEIDILYGEVKPIVKIGDSIKAGDHIGNILKVLKKDKGLPMSMLHLECRTNFENHTLWLLNKPQPDNLLNPDLFIKSLYNKHYNINDPITLDIKFVNKSLFPLEYNDFRTQIYFDNNMYLPNGLYSIEQDNKKIYTELYLDSICNNIIKYKGDNSILEII